MPRVDYKLTEPVNNRPFHVIGTGLTRAAAVAEANAKLALTVGTVVGSSVSDVLTGPETGAVAAGGVYSDAELILRRTSDGHKVAIHLENIDNALGTGVNGQLDLTNQDLIDFATAYRDGAGGGGYAVFDGYFVK